MSDADKNTEGEWPRLDCGHEVFDPEQVHYCEYISSETLLDLAEPNASSPRRRSWAHHDERQFVVVHQMCELAFGQMIFELKHVIELLPKGKLDEASHFLKRIVRYTETTRRLMGLLGTMHRRDFEAFREPLAPASGAESIQYRIIQILSGLTADAKYAKNWDQEHTFRDMLNRPPSPEDDLPKTRWWTEQMEEASRGPSLASCFDELLEKRELTIRKLYEEHGTDPLRRLADALYSYECAFLKLQGYPARKDTPADRDSHLYVAEKGIGSKAGTGHTSGVAYLASVVSGRSNDTPRALFFPELWEFRKTWASRVAWDSD